LKKLAHYGEEDYGYEKDILFCIIEEPLVDQVILSKKIYSMEWILDSSCTNHMIGKIYVFSTLDSSYQSSIRLGDEKNLKVVAKGDIVVTTRKGKMKVKDIYYTPHLKNYLVIIG